MRILHVVPSYLPAWRYGGPIRSVHGLAAAQAALGHQVEVFTTDADGAKRLAVPTDRPVDRDGVAVHYFRGAFPRRLYRSPGLARACRERLRELDVAHLHSVFLLPTRVAAGAACRAGVPYLVAPRGMLVPELIRGRGRWRKRFWLHLFDRRTLSGAAAIHVTSRIEGTDAARVVLSLPPRVVLPNGIAAEELTRPTPARPPCLAPLGEAPYALFLGRLSWKKRLDRLVAAIPLAPPELHWVVAGNDDEGLIPRLEAQAWGLGVAARLHFTGEVHGEEKAALLGNALALVLPSRSENFGIVVLESLAAGRPVVVTPGVGLAPEVREGCGLVVEPEPAALAAAVARLHAEPAAATWMGTTGRALVAERFTWEAVARQSLTIYEEILARAPGRERE